MRPKEVMKYHVVVSSNERYMPGAMVAMASVALNAKTSSYFVFHLFSEGVKEETFNVFKKTLLRLHPNGEVCHHPMIDEMLKDLPYWATSRMAAARCLYSEILSDVDWCLYLDCDVLYLASPEEHFSYCDDAKFAVVTPEQSKETRLKECQWIKNVCDVTVLNEEYFNSGVMLFNFKLMRKKQMAKKLLEFFAAHADVGSPDQDALNTLFVGNTVLMPPKWNRLQIFLNDDALSEKPVIHYVSGVPWLPNFGTTANGRFRLWHQFADKYIWQKEGESYRRLFTKRAIFVKYILYYLLKSPFIGLCFAKVLEKFKVVTSASGWRQNQIACDVSSRAIRQIID